jgi:hypothetical protein
VLVDSLLDLKGLGARLKPPSYGRLAAEGVLLGSVDTSSYRRALSFYMQNNQYIMSPGLPSPFITLQDIYRIVASEWIILNTYIVRDLNEIGWNLLSADGRLQSKLDETLDVLFSSLWRLSWILQLVEKQLQSCREHGHVSWGARSTLHDANPPNEAALSTLLVKDFEHVHSQLSQSSKSVEETISHVMAQLGLQETGRAVTQNKVLMVISLVAVPFLPATLISAILSMQGDWAPGQPKFGWYWAIVVPPSALLLILLVVLWFWASISFSMDSFQTPRNTRAPSAPRNLQWGLAGREQGISRPPRAYLRHPSSHSLGKLEAAPLTRIVSLPDRPPSGGSEYPELARNTNLSEGRLMSSVQCMC